MNFCFVDQMGRKVELEGVPQRIVSLVPSQTELLYHLGLDQRVVGITKFCIHPEEWFRTKTRVGGTKRVNIDVIRGLEPDLIIGNKEENTKEDIALLMSIAPVWMSDIYDLEDALEMVRMVGNIVQENDKASEIASDIFQQFQSLPAVLKEKKVLYFIWKNPYMVAGGTTFIHSLIETLGGENVGSLLGDRYPEVELENNQLCPDIVLLSSEPYPFKDTDVCELQAVYPQAEIILVDGEFFSWYGSRLRGTVPYVKTLFL